MFKQTPLLRDYERKARFFLLSTERAKKMSASVLHGQRRFGWPMMALQTQRELGPVRHAISQMVVSGTMTIFPPWVKPPAPPPHDPDSKQDP